MFDRQDYIIEKILTRLQNSFSVKQLNECKQILFKLPNLDMVNQPSETFEDSTLGWLTISKLFEKLMNDNLEISLDNLKKHYNLREDCKVIARSFDEIDPALLIKEDKKSLIDRLLSEHGEENYCDDFFEDELTEEGLRQASFLESSQTSFEGEDLRVKNKMPIVEVRKNQQIISPWGNTEIYQINATTFLDIEEDREFKVREIN